MAKRIYPDVRQKKNKAVYIGKNGEKIKNYLRFENRATLACLTL